MVDFFQRHGRQSSRPLRAKFWDSLVTGTSAPGPLANRSVMRLPRFGHNLVTDTLFRCPKSVPVTSIYCIGETKEPGRRCWQCSGTPGRMGAILSIIHSTVWQLYIYPYNVSLNRHAGDIHTVACLLRTTWDTESRVVLLWCGCRLTCFKLKESVANKHTLQAAKTRYRKTEPVTGIH